MVKNVAGAEQHTEIILNLEFLLKIETNFITRDIQDGSSSNGLKKYMFPIRRTVMRVV